MSIRRNLYTYLWRCWHAIVYRDTTRQLPVWTDKFDGLEDYLRHVWRVE